MPIDDKKKMKYSRKKDKGNHLIKDDNSSVLEAKEKLLKGEKFSPEVKRIIDDVFTDMTKDEVEENTIKANENIVSAETKDLDKDISDIVENAAEIKEKESMEKDKELKTFYENKQKELEEKIEEYKGRYQKLEEATEKYEVRNRELLKKRKEYEETINEFEKKSQALEDSKEDFKNQSEKLQEAREHLVESSKQLEMKKTELAKLEKKLFTKQRTFEKSKYEFEKNKIDFEKEKLEFEMGRSELEIKAKERGIKDYTKIEKEEEKIIEKGKKLRGKAAILEDLLKNLSNDGIFQSCFLIDGKGMLVSDYVIVELNRMAVGAMFSLICTIALRTVNSLNLQELNHFKISSINGEFMAKNINISNYDRNFILLTYYDGKTPIISQSQQKVNKKVINKIIKSIKEDFYEFGQGSKVSWIFDNLAEKISFLKQKYSIPETDIELKRLDLLNKTSIKIKELFES